MEEKVNALMIKSVDYGDNDKILTLFSLEKGIISAKIKGVKKAKAKLKFAGEPFCFAEYILLGKNDLYSVINASLHDGFFPLRTDICKFYSAGTATEFVKKFCPERVVCEDVFINLCNTLKYLSYTECSPVLALLIFIVRSLKEVGYGIETTNCADCGEKITRPFFDFSTGSFYCKDCVKEGFIEIRVSTYNLIKLVLENGFTLLESDFSIDDETSKRALKLMAKYLNYNTNEELKNLKELLNL